MLTSLLRKSLANSLLVYVTLVITFLTAFLPLATAHALPNVVDSTTNAKIEDYVQQQSKAARIPGVALGIVQGSRPTLVKGFGDVGPNTPFFLASLSKSFTALAIMQLVDQGKVNLNVPVIKYIPWFKVGNGVESGTMTVLQLLNQTSGLSTQAGQAVLSFNPSTTLPEAIKDSEKFPLAAKPGKTFEYSNANYIVAGYIVEQASGQSYGTYVQQHIFAPLDMPHTYATSGAAQMSGLTKGHANWFGFKLPLTEHVAPALIPDGYIISSASDMTHYLTAQMNDGIYNGTRIVSAHAVQEMHTGNVSLNGQDAVPDAMTYGLGWGVGVLNGTAIISHDGQLSDFQTNMSILPEKKIAVVSLINEDGLLLNEGKIYEGVMQGITTGTFPSISHFFIVFYMIFDLIVLVTIILMIRSFWRLRNWLRKFQKRATKTGFRRAFIKAVGLDVSIAIVITVAIAYGLGAMFGSIPLTPTLMMFGTPDIAVWLYLIIVFFVVRAATKAFIIIRTR